MMRFHRRSRRINAGSVARLAGNVNGRRQLGQLVRVDMKLTQERQVA